MKFSELTDMARACRVKLNEYVSIEVEYNTHNTGDEEVFYRFYTESGKHHKFGTVQEMKEHMERILVPPVDEGVDV